MAGMFKKAADAYVKWATQPKKMYSKDYNPHGANLGKKKRKNPAAQQARKAMNRDKGLGTSGTGARTKQSPMISGAEKQVFGPGYKRKWGSYGN